MAVGILIRFLCLSFPLEFLLGIIEEGAPFICGSSHRFLNHSRLGLWGPYLGALSKFSLS